MKFLISLLRRLRLTDGEAAEASRVKIAMRARVSELAKQGRAHEALRENLALMGIDLSKGGRPKLVAVGKSRFDR
jgi:hypothetical protein